MTSLAEKIGVFVDVQNIYYTTRDAFEKSFDYRTLWQRLSSRGNIIIAKAYAIDRRDESQRKFQNALRHIGFSVHLKPFIQRADGSAKGDWDVGITIDVMEHAKDVDVVVLASGDGDFDLLMSKIRNDFDVSTEVYGVADLTAKSLINSTSSFIPIEGELVL